MFVRVKLIKNQKYAYLVENKWHKSKKSARQKTTKYLGKIITLKKDTVPVQSLDKTSLFSQPLKDACVILLKLELEKYGFLEEKESIFKYGQIIIDLNQRKITQGGKPVSIELNQGFLNNYTIQEIMDYRPPEATRKEVAKSLATTLISGGLELDPSFFIDFFQNYYSHLD